MLVLIPNSNSEDAAPVREFNPCHTPAGPTGGQFCATGGGATGAVAKDFKQSVDLAQPASQVAGVAPIKVKTVEEALDLIHKGQVVEVEDVRTVHTLLTKLAGIALEAKAKGEKAPHYDLCKVTVKGSNLFCADRIRSEQYPEGVVRIKMPQFSAEPLPGTPADQLPRMPGKKTRVDASQAFVDHLEASGIQVGGMLPVPAGALKASQAELIGVDVARMMTAKPDPKTGKTYDPGADPIFISSDGYVLDGHHRWAAVVGRDAADGHLGSSTINAIRINAPMSTLLFAAMDWAEKFGLKPKGVTKESLALDHLWMLN